MITVRIFLDDERFPVLKTSIGYEPDTDIWVENTLNGQKIWNCSVSDIIICRTVPSAMAVLTQYRDQITEIMFDNDLGEELEGRHFAKMLVEWDMDELEAERNGLSPNLKISVHSQNVPAAQYIHDFMASYLKQKKKTKI